MDLAREKAADAAVVWIFEGTVGDVTVKWSTAALAGYEPRMVEPPSSITLGLSPTIGALERPSFSISVATHGIESLLVGHGSEEVDFWESSVIGLSGRLYRVEVARDGTRTKRTISPPSVATGATRVEQGVVSVSLAADEEPLVGHSVNLSTVEDWRTGAVSVYEIAEQIYERLRTVDPQEVVSRFQGELETNLRMHVPWLYGAATVPVQSISREKGRWQMVGIVSEEYVLDLIHKDLSLRYADSGERVVFQSTGPWPLFLQHDSVEGVLMVLLTDLSAIKGQQAEHREIVFSHLGAFENPAQIVGLLFADHAGKSVEAYDTDSLDRVRSRLTRWEGIIGGSYGDAATIRELLECISEWTGLEYFHNEKGRIEFVPFPTLDDLPEFSQRIVPADALPTGPEGIPAVAVETPDAAGSFGAPAAIVSVQWAQHQMDAWPQHTRSDMRRSYTQVEGEQRELQLDGSWINPLRSSPALSAVAGRVAHPIRLVSIPTYIEALDEWEGVRPGRMVRFRAPTIPDGDRERIGMVRSVEIRPGDEVAVLTIADIGYAGMVRYGVLDSWGNWVRHLPDVGDRVQLHSGNRATFTPGMLTLADVGRTLWITRPFGGGNRKSLRISAMLDASNAVLDGTVSAETIIEDSANPGDKRFYIMDTAHIDADDHPDKIAGADRSTGRFDDGSRGYRYSP